MRAFVDCVGVTTSPDQGSHRTIRSVEIAFDNVDALQEHNQVGVTDLSEELDYAKSAIHSHLRTLEEQAVIVRENDCYRLSIRILDKARHVREQSATTT